MNLEQEGENVLKQIKKATWFPYKTGKLRDKATSGQMINATTYEITFDGNKAVDKYGNSYLDYLELGTAPHDIPRAFGKDLPFGIGGKFDGKFHPGSTKHKGFIKDKSINAITNYFITRFKGTMEIK